MVGGSDFNQADAMGRSSTWYVKASTVASRSEIASIMVRLMMSINDLSLINNSIIEWSESTDRKKLKRKTNGTLYYVRILMGHVYEVLKMIKVISEYSQLRDAVMNCDRQTIEAFLLVEAYANSPELDILEDFRNKAAFHYDRCLPIENLKKITKERPDQPYAYSMGHDGLDWHFELADAVMDRMLIRDIFKQDYDKSAERTKKVEEIAIRQQEIARAFTNFAGHFIRHYSK
jgi:hypothetical protein